MKTKTLNAQRRTPNVEVATNRTSTADAPMLAIEWLGVREDEGAYSTRAETLNVQRSTSNVQRPSEPRFDLEERLLEFSANIIRLIDALPNTRAANHVAGQLLRCGTSPLGNHGEVQAAESRRDFVHKLRICLKEFKETRRWLRLLKRAQLLSTPKMEPVLQETEELIRIFAASVRTAEKNAK
jgi:four helix bundle protein